MEDEGEDVKKSMIDPETGQLRRRRKQMTTIQEGNDDEETGSVYQKRPQQP